MNGETAYDLSADLPGPRSKRHIERHWLPTLRIMRPLISPVVILLTCPLIVLAAVLVDFQVAQPPPVPHNAKQCTIELFQYVVCDYFTITADMYELQGVPSGSHTESELSIPAILSLSN